MFHATVIMVMVWVGFFFFFFVILVLKVIIHPLFHFPAYGRFGKTPATPCVAKFFPPKAGAGCGSGHVQEPPGICWVPAQGAMLSQRPQDRISVPSPKPLQLPICSSQPVANSEYCSSLAGVRSALLWNHLAYFRQRVCCALPRFPGVRRVSSRISATRPHTSHVPTPSILPCFSYSGHSRAVFRSSSVPVTCPPPHHCQISTAASHSSHQGLS